MDDLSLAHSRYNCTYHIVFIPKYRRKAMFGALRKEVNRWPFIRKYVLVRYGGDEFLLIIPGEHLDKHSRKLEDIKFVFETPISVGSETVSLTVSMGISNSDETITPDNLIIEAELAMYEA